MQTYLSYHVCGGTIGHGGSGETRHKYCDRCGAFTYDLDADLPTGTDRAANRAAYDNGDDESPAEATRATYTINTEDSDEPSRWMSTQGILSMTPGSQDSGRCRWTVTTTDPSALESALESDESVIEYSEVQS
jgi:hypothetical protein